MKLQKIALILVFVLTGISLESQADTTICGDKTSGTAFEIIDFALVFQGKASFTRYENGAFKETQRPFALSQKISTNTDFDMGFIYFRTIQTTQFVAETSYFSGDGTQVYVESKGRATKNGIIDERTVIVTRIGSSGEQPAAKETRLKCKIQ